MSTDDDRKCDRCVEQRPATQTVECWYGCTHHQCDECAQRTKLEAKSLTGMIVEVNTEPLLRRESSDGD